MADREGRKTEGNNNIDQFTVCALRVFGLRMVVLGTGSYGGELEGFLRRQGRIERDQMWQMKLRIPITNRISRASAFGIFGDIPTDGTEEIPVTLGDCSASGAQKYRAFARVAGEIEGAEKDPRTLPC